MSALLWIFAGLVTVLAVFALFLLWINRSLVMLAEAEGDQAAQADAARESVRGALAPLDASEAAIAAARREGWK